MINKKVLVLGATGNLGAYSAVALKNAGFDVIAAGRRESDNQFFKEQGIEYSCRFCGRIAIEMCI